MATGRLMWPMRRWGVRLLLAMACMAAILFAGLWWFADRVDRVVNPVPETIVAASLQGLREQNRLSAFVASYVAVVTSTQRRFGMEAKKTLILPGLVRYEVDMAKLRPEDVTWSGVTNTLSVVLPPIEVVGPQVDLTRIREYDGGGLLMKLTDARSALDQSNRRAAQVELLRQAREPVPVGLAKDATRRAVERSFAMPLRAAGLEARVRVRFPDEAAFPLIDDRPLDRSRSVRQVYDAR